ncbi:MAG TPA: VCBS repeat-containing protein [Clostridia bacterium]|nr:VCBS repeat-containing protein [Clostridia bacterium]
MGRKRTLKKKSMSEYASSYIPSGAIIQFIFYEDFDNDGIKEAIIGFSRFSPFPPDSAILLIKSQDGEFRHIWVPMSDNAALPDQSGIIDSAAAADTDNDGIPELIVSRTLDNEHEIEVIVYDWTGDSIAPVWRSGETFYHGSMEVDDTDSDGISEIIIEYGVETENELFEVNESCYHVRAGYSFKWDGACYARKEYKVRMPYISFNTAADFLNAIWAGDFEKAYEKVVFPGFLGLDGLNDSSPSAFKSYLEKKVVPVIVRNLEKGKLVPAEPSDTCCQFYGAADTFSIELVRVNGRIMVSGLNIIKII